MCGGGGGGMIDCVQWNPVSAEEISTSSRI